MLELEEVLVEPPTATRNRRSRRGLVLSVAAVVGVVSVVAIAAVALNRGDSKPVRRLPAALEAAFSQMRQQSRVEFMTTTDDERPEKRRMTMDADRRLIRIEEVAGRKVDDRGTSVQIIDLDAGAMYSQGGNAFLPGDTRWFRNNLIEDAPQKYADMLRTGSQLFEGFADVVPETLNDFGLEQVDGEPVEHFILMFDLAKLVRAHPGLVVVEPASAAQGAVLLEVFVTDSNQVKRAKLTTLVNDEVVSGTTIDIIGVGDSVVIDVPTQDEVEPS